MVAFRGLPIVGDASLLQWGEVLMTPDGCAIAELSGEASKERGIAFLESLEDYLSNPHNSLDSLVSVPKLTGGILIETVFLLRIVGDEVTLLLKGQGSGYLKRGSQVSKLMYREGVMTGTVVAGDQLLLGSKSFIRTFSEGDLYGLFDHLTPEEIAEKAAVALYASEHRIGAAGIVIGFETRTESIKIIPQVRPIKEASRSPFHNVDARSIGSEILKKWKVLLAVILIGGFIVSIITGVSRQMRSTQNKQSEEAFASAQRLLDEGVSLLELNAVKSRDRLKEAKNIIEPFMSAVNPRTQSGKKVADLYQQIQDNLTLAYHTLVVDPALYYDVSFLKSGATVTTFGIAGDKMSLLDNNSRTLFTLSLSTKRGAIVGGGEGLTQAIATDTDGNLVYAATDKGIQETKVGAPTSTKLVIPKDSEWGTISSISVFGGNIYLLDRGKSRIWKYIATENGFTQRQQYVNPDENPDLSIATSMSIDGAVWLGTTSGRILKFIQGKEQTFFPQGVDPGFGTNLFVYTSDDAVHVYVLDSDQRRVVVLDKDGIYLAQYTWESGFAPSEIVVSEVLKKIFLLAEGKLYYIDLK